MGKFRKKKTRKEFSKDKLGKIEKGANFSTFIGSKNVYKKVHRKIGLNQAQVKKILNDTITGYELLREAGVPVTLQKPSVLIRGEKRLVFEKARDIRPDEFAKRLPEVLNIVKKVGEKGIYIDTFPQNFGINKHGKIVVRDTNLIKKDRHAKRNMLNELEASLHFDDPRYAELKKKIDRLKRNR